MIYESQRAKTAGIIVGVYRDSPFPDNFLYSLSKRKEVAGLDLMLLFHLCEAAYQCGVTETLQAENNHQP